MKTNTFVVARDNLRLGQWAVRESAPLAED